MVLLNAPYIHEYANIKYWVIEHATKPEHDILQSCSVLASHWVMDVEFESVIAACASVFALKITYSQLVVSFINATAVSSSERRTFAFFTCNLLRLKQNGNL